MSAPFFIVGCDRSGTTLLRVMLTCHSKVFIPPETAFLPRLWERAADYGDFSSDRQRWLFIRDVAVFSATGKTQSLNVLGLDEDEAYLAIKITAPHDYPSACAQLFRAAASKKGKKFWGEKTPDNTFYIPRLAAMYPGSKFIHLIRDPRAVALSMMRVDFGENTAEGGAERWLKRVAIARDEGRKLGSSRYREFRYESLVTKPYDTLSNLCQWLNFRYETAMLDYPSCSENLVRAEHKHLFELINSPPRTDRIHAWRHALNSSEINDVELVAGALMRELNYTSYRSI